MLNKWLECVYQRSSVRTKSRAFADIKTFQAFETSVSIYSNGDSSGIAMVIVMVIVFIVMVIVMVIVIVISIHSISDL